MSSKRTLVFNALVWLQTIVSFVVSVITAYLRQFLNLRSNQPTDPEWIQLLLREKFGHLPPLATIEKSSESIPGRGLAGSIFKVLIKYSQREEDWRDTKPAYPQSLVIKTNKEGFQARMASTFFQMAREAIFYERVVPRHSIFSSCVPELYYSRGSLVTGEFMIVMEDLTGRSIPSSLLLGDQCWGGAAALPAELKGISAYKVIATIFLKIANIHAHFWQDKTLMKNEWMHGVLWRKGSGRLRWEAAFDNMHSQWTSLKGKESFAAFSALQRDVIERLFKQTNWSKWQRLINSDATPFTLVHGDFHAGNVLWRIDREVDQAIFVDWSEAGVGCPFTELAQFMISNATIEFRRENERQLFEEYHRCLLDLGVHSSEIPLEKCWTRYKEGGIERWLQLLIVLAYTGIPQTALEWFCQQVDTFLHDHLSSIPQCFSSVYCIPLLENF